MKKKSNYLFLNTYINYNFNIGEVVKVFYITKLRNKRRVYNLIGLCFFKNSNKFIIFNKLKKEKIQVTFTLHSPAILKIFVIKMYKPFIFRISKIYFKKNLFLKEDFYALNSIQSNIKSYRFEFFKFFNTIKVNKKKRKKLYSKYKYRDTWDWKEIVNSAYLRSDRYKIENNVEEFEEMDDLNLLYPGKSESPIVEYSSTEFLLNLNNYDNNDSF